MSKENPICPIRFALAWYHPKQWRLLREKAADREAIEETYEEWLETAVRKAAELESEGYAVRKILIDIGEWEKWSFHKNLPLDGASRAHYAAHLAASHAKGGKDG